MAAPTGSMQAQGLRPDSPFQSVIGLGPLQGEYLYSGRGKWVTLATGIGLLLAAPACLLWGIYLVYDQYNYGGTAGLDDALRSAALPGIGGVLAFVLALGIFYGAWKNWNLAVALYEKGLAYFDRKGLRQVAWAEVRAVYQTITKHYTNGVYTGTTHNYTLHTRDGQKLVLDDRLGKKVEDLGRSVQTGVSGALFSGYVQALQSGQRLDFGPLAIDREKVYAGKKELRWDEIKAIKIEQGSISVRKDKGWFAWASATVPQIPNFFIFYELISRLTTVE